MFYKNLAIYLGATLLFAPLGALAQKAKPSPIAVYLESKQYAPAPTHDSRWVPGGLIRVNWHTGLYEYVKPLGGFKPLGIVDSTQQLDKDFNANAQGAGAAASAITDLLGKVGIKLTGEADYTFSGVEFATKSLDADELALKKILADKTDDTYAYLANESDGILRDSYDVYVVTEVEYATSLSMKANMTFGISGGVNVDASADACKLPEMPKFDSDAGAAPKTGNNQANSSSQGSPANAPSDKGKSQGAPSGQSDSASSPSSSPTTGTTGSKKTADGEQKKADANSASALPGGSFFYSRCSGDEALFSNPKPTPTALKLAEIILTPTGDLVLYSHGDPVPVPLDDRNALKRSVQCNSRLSKWLPACKAF